MALWNGCLVLRRWATFAGACLLACWFFVVDQAWLVALAVAVTAAGWSLGLLARHRLVGSMRSGGYGPRWFR